MLIQQIQRATCLTLDKRIDWATSVIPAAAKYGIDVELFIAGDGTNPDISYNHIDLNELPPLYPQSLNYPSWTTKPFAYNAWQCHTKIIRQAQQDGIGNLLMLEDDIFFEEDFIEILDKIEDFFNSNAWDMIYFGWYSSGHLKETDNEHVYRMMGGGGFHAVLLSRYMIECLSDVPPLGPYDFITGVFFHQNINAYAIYPSIISQRNGFSNVEQGTLDKPDRYKK